MEVINLLKNVRIINRENIEYYNSLKTNLQFLGKDVKVISFSSVSSNEGKSVVSINLAVSLAESDLKVLYIDADTRNSSFAGRFRFIDKSYGLTYYLSGNCSEQEIFYKTNVKGLDVVPSGKFPPNPTTLLQSKIFSEFLSTCRENYDYVIVDTPPIGIVIDAAIITSNCDGSVLVVESGKIKRKFVKKAILQLEQTGAPFLGVILNKVDLEKNYYGNYGSYGNYGNYGSYGK